MANFFGRIVETLDRLRGSKRRKDVAQKKKQVVNPVKRGETRRKREAKKREKVRRKRRKNCSVGKVSK